MAEFYDIPSPETVEDLAPADAQRELNKLNASYSDNPDHPYLNRNHAQHDDQVAYVTALHKATARDIPPEPRTPAEIEQHLLDLDERRRQDRMDHGKHLIGELESLGFARSNTPLPADLHDVELELLELQLAGARGDHQAVGDRVHQLLMGLARPPEHVERAWQSYRYGSGQSDAAKEAALDVVLRWTLQEQRRKHHIERIIE